MEIFIIYDDSIHVEKAGNLVQMNTYILILFCHRVY